MQGEVQRVHAGGSLPDRGQKLPREPLETSPGERPRATRLGAVGRKQLDVTAGVQLVQDAVLPPPRLKRMQ